MHLWLDSYGRSASVKLRRKQHTAGLPTVLQLQLQLQLQLFLLLLVMICILLVCRVAFLQKAFREEFEPRKKASKVSSQNAAADAIRPGSFLSCIKASKEQMQNMKGVEPTLSKLEVIRLEALRVLESMAA